MTSPIGSRKANRLWCRVAQVVLLSLWITRSSAPSWAGEEVAKPRVDGLGRLSGQIRLIGEPPIRDILARLRNGLVIPDETLEVDPVGRGIANVFVSLRRVPPGIAIPPAPEEPVTIRMVGLRFAPHAAVVRVGQPLRVVNLDLVPNMFENFPLENNLVKWLIRPGMQQELVYQNPERVMVNTRNGLALMMRGTHLVLDHPWFAISDSQGRFTIRGLPPGRHEFVLRHEHAGYLERRWVVEIAAGETTTRDAEFELTRFFDIPAKPVAGNNILSVGPFDIEQVGTGEDLVVGRHLLISQLTQKMNQLDQIVDLTAEQRKELTQAGVEEIEQLLDEVQVIRTKFQRVRDDEAPLRQFLAEDLPDLDDRISTDAFGPRSLFGKALDTVLTSDQWERLKDRPRAAVNRAPPMRSPP